MSTYVAIFNRLDEETEVELPQLLARLVSAETILEASGVAERLYPWLGLAYIIGPVDGPNAILEIA